MKLSLVPKELFLEIYKDLAQPGVREVGKAIGGIVGLTNIPIRILTGRGAIIVERNLENFRLKMAQVPIEQITEAIPEIAVPILDKLTYTTSEELVDMFTNILKNASTANGVQYAHPSFVNILSSISRDEAIILQDKQKGISTPSLKVKQTFVSENYLTPIVIFTHYYHDSRLDFPEQDQFYHQNLVKIGLCYAHGGILSSGTYIKLRSELEPVLEKLRTPETKDFSVINEHVGLTSIGRQFLKSIFE